MIGQFFLRFVPSYCRPGLRVALLTNQIKNEFYKPIFLIKGRYSNASEHLLYADWIIFLDLEG